MRAKPFVVAASTTVALFLAGCGQQDSIQEVTPPPVSSTPTTSPEVSPTPKPSESDMTVDGESPAEQPAPVEVVETAVGDAFIIPVDGGMSNVESFSVQNSDDVASSTPIVMGISNLDFEEATGALPEGGIPVLAVESGSANVVINTVDDGSFVYGVTVS